MDGIKRDEHDEPGYMEGIEARATMEGSGGITKKSWETAKMLKNHYNAILYDPQTGRNIKNVKKCSYYKREK